MRTTMNQIALALLLAGLAITGCQLPVEGLMNSSKDPANGGTANQPASPTGVSASASNGQVTIQWTAVTGATSYNIYWSTTTGVTTATGTKIASAVSPYTQTGLTNGTAYYYVVTAVVTSSGNSSVESSASSQVGATPQVSAPGAPIGFGASAGNGQVTLTWTAISGALSYNIYRSTTSNFTQSASNKIANPTINTYNDTTVSNGTTYYYLTTALNPGGESSASSYASATPQLPAPSAPANVVTTPSYDQNTITWNTVSGATSYNIYWSTSSGVTPSSGTKIPSVSSGYIHTGLTGGSPYYYVVTAQNAAGESVASGQVGGTPLYSVYAGGYSINASGITVPGYWLNGTWEGLPQITANGCVTSLVVNGHNIYAVGYSVDSTLSVIQASYWLDGSGTLLSPPTGTVFSEAESVTVVGGNVYVAGGCENSSNVVVPGYWLNGVWNELTPISSTQSGWAYSIQVVNGNVYAAGQCANLSGIMLPGYWLNGSWIALANDSSSQNSVANSILVVGSNVYVGGQSQTSAGGDAAYWYNGSLTNLPLDANATQPIGEVYSAFKSNSDLYLGGYRYGSTGQVPGYWDNGTWNQLASLSTNAGNVQSIFVAGGHVYAGGYSEDSSSVLVPGYWLDGSWVPLSQLSANHNSNVYSVVLQ